MKTAKIKTAPPFNELFPIDDDTLLAIKQDMEQNGYDTAMPIVVWGTEGVVVDGHTRLRAAVEVGLDDVPVILKPFADEDAAFRYAVHNQRDRRSMKAADVLRLVEACDKRRMKGGDRKSVGSTGPTGMSSADETAELVGISPSTVKRVRTIMDHGDEKTKRAVRENKTSIRAAADKTQAQRKEQGEVKPSGKTFNRTNENVDWAQWTWNPVTGCKHGCKYCYARDIAMRFNGHFNPEFHADRIGAPLATPLPKSDNPASKRVFVGSMCDLFGDWVPQEWIDKVLRAVREAPAWTFMFLTKNPKRLVDIDWPDNAWVGTTIDTQARVASAVEAFHGVDAKFTFVSCEPLCEPVDFAGDIPFDLVIIGARSRSSQMPAMQPEWAWTKALLHDAWDNNVATYVKPNVDLVIKEV